MRDSFAHRDALPTPPRRINPNIPPARESILRKVLAKEPSARYRTADQLGRVLLTFSNTAGAYEVNIPTGPNSPAAPAQPQATTDAPAVNIHRPRPVRPDDTLPNVNEPVGPAIDWANVLLGLLAVLTVGGLVPFWLYIILSLRNLIR